MLRGDLYEVYISIDVEHATAGYEWKCFSII